MNNLKQYAGLLNDEAPEDHFLAYITTSERDMLVEAGGVKTPTSSGIFAYPPDNDARGQSTGSSSSSNSGGDSLTLSTEVLVDGSWLLPAQDLSDWAQGEILAEASVIDLAGNTATNSDEAIIDTQALITFD